MHRCGCSRPVAALAYVALAYLMACLAYVAVVRCAGIGTPFRDSLTAEQLALKRESARARATIFWGGLGTAAAVLTVLRPLR